MKLYLRPLVLWLVLAGCHSDKDTPSANKTHDQIQGSWRLVSANEVFRDAAGAQLHSEPGDGDEYSQLDFAGNIIRLKDSDGYVVTANFIVDEAFNEKRITITTPDGDSGDYKITSFSPINMQWEYVRGNAGWWSADGEFHKADTHVSVYTFSR